MEFRFAGRYQITTQTGKTASIYLSTLWNQRSQKQFFLHVWLSQLPHTDGRTTLLVVMEQYNDKGIDHITISITSSSSRVVVHTEIA